MLLSLAVRIVRVATRSLVPIHAPQVPESFVRHEHGLRLGERVAIGRLGRCRRLIRARRSRAGIRSLGGAPLARMLVPGLPVPRLARRRAVAHGFAARTPEHRRLAAEIAPLRRGRRVAAGLAADELWRSRAFCGSHRHAASLGRWPRHWRRQEHGRHERERETQRYEQRRERRPQRAERQSFNTWHPNGGCRCPTLHSTIPRPAKPCIRME